MSHHTENQKDVNFYKLDFILKKLQLEFPVADLAKKTGYSESTISPYLNGKVKPSSKFLQSILNAYEIDLNGFDENSINNNDFKNAIEIQEPTGYYYPKVSAAAGMDKEMVNDELKRIPINLPNWEKGIDFINVYGDSMYPKFCSGEIIGIKEVELQYLNYGFAYVVILKDEQVLLKFVKKSKKENYIILESENKFYEPKEYHLDQIKKVFIIKGVITKTTM